MTYNVKAFLNIQQTGGLARVAWEVRQHDPDVVVMQDRGQQRRHDDKLSGGFLPLVQGRRVYAFGQFIVTDRLPMRLPMAVCRSSRKRTYVRCG